MFLLTCVTMLAGLPGCGVVHVTAPFGQSDSLLNVEGEWTLLVDRVLPEMPANQSIKMRVSPRPEAPGDYEVVFDHVTERQADGSPHTATYELRIRRFGDDRLLFMRGMSTTIEEPKKQYPHEHYFVHGLSAGMQDLGTPQVLLVWMPDATAFRMLADQADLVVITNTQKEFTVDTHDRKLQALFGDMASRRELIQSLFYTTRPFILVRTPQN
ncbi:MAG: hypothetical protein AAGA57_05365 [Planctomycetota bacterium]